MSHGLGDQLAAGLIHVSVCAQASRRGAWHFNTLCPLFESLHRFYKPSFSSDPWQQLAAAAQRQAAAPDAAHCSRDQQVLPKTAVGHSGGRSLAELLDDGVEEITRAGQEAAADRPWH